MAASDAVLLASGTATLEATLVKRPMVVAYRFGALTSFLLKHLKLFKAPFFAQPNLLAGRQIVPEYFNARSTRRRARSGAGGATRACRSRRARANFHVDPRDAAPRRERARSRRDRRTDAVANCGQGTMRTEQLAIAPAATACWRESTKPGAVRSPVRSSRPRSFSIRAGACAASAIRRSSSRRSARSCR